MPSASFPAGLLRLVRCPRDGGDLDVEAAAVDGRGIENGSVRCVRCGSAYPIADGILDLLSREMPDDARSALEMEARDRDARSRDHPGGLPPWHPPWRDELEIPETLRCIGDVAGLTVLELGCGTGLYTRLLAERAARVVAVDFSLDSLRINARHLVPPGAAALVRADVTRLRLRPESFDLALSTLYSNLPTDKLRAAANRAVHEALAPGGRYVVSAHHQDLRRRLRGLALAGIYGDDFPVFFQCFTARSLRRELREFEPISLTPIVALIPYLSRFRRARRVLSRAAATIPVFGAFSQLLLAAATKPRVPPGAN